MRQPVLLIVEDDELLCTAYVTFLQELQITVHTAGTLLEAINVFERIQPDMVLLDLLLPDGHGTELLNHARAAGSRSSILVITAENSVESTRQALLAGAEDYLLKPLSRDRLLTTVQNTLERLHLREKVQQMESTLSPPPVPELVGDSLQMKTVYSMIRNASSCDASVFINGESGTGKELCAEAVHRLSHRSANPFVALNCAAIPAELMESEIFGHTRGAFSGASGAREGAAGRVSGGTLFLDEICDLDYSLQAKLLRLLQSGQYRPLGSDRELIMDARIICASNKPPLREVQAGRFREDLYYRLCVLPLTMPPLRDRGSDIRLLASHFIGFHSNDLGRQPIPRLSESAWQNLCSCGWPGNVRQLSNVIQNILVMNPQQFIDGDTVMDLLRQLDNDPGNFTAAPPPADSSSPNTRPLNGNSTAAVAQGIVPLWQQEKEIIEQAVAICDGNIAEAARQLEINCSTIYRKIKRWNS